MTITQYLSGNRYPGRGILIGRTPSGKMVIAYFIMGRSENSRNRIFVENDLGGIKTVAFDESKLTDPSLVIYNCVREFNNELIVTNGDQTDTIFDLLTAGKTFEDALRLRTFEPDPPIYTPRISGIVHSGGYILSILKKTGKQFFDYSAEAGLQSGVGHIIHTYQADGEPVPSFAGEPVALELPDDLDALASELWGALDEENKVSLYVRCVDCATSRGGSSYQTRIINKHGTR